jgi:hypothetical protein
MAVSHSSLERISDALPLCTLQGHNGVYTTSVQNLALTYYTHNSYRSYWIPGSYAPTLSKNRHSFLTLLKNKGSKEERMTKVGLLRHRQLHAPGIQQEPLDHVV